MFTARSERLVSSIFKATPRERGENGHMTKAKPLAALGLRTIVLEIRPETMMKGTWRGSIHQLNK